MLFIEANTQPGTEGTKQTVAAVSRLAVEHKQHHWQVAAIQQLLPAQKAGHTHIVQTQYLHAKSQAMTHTKDLSGSIRQG